MAHSINISSMTSMLSLVALLLGAATVDAASLIVVNHCGESFLLSTQTSSGSINNNVNVAPGNSVNMGISGNWIGAINTGTGCNSGGTSCTTGGSPWDGRSPFSRAEFNFASTSVTYDISMIYGYNAGMQISSADTSCDAFACTIGSNCPVPGPNGSCYSPCCSSAAACSGGALPAGGGGCVNNEGPGPNSPFYYNACYNAYAFPDNDGANGYTPQDFVVYTCSNTDLTLTLCPGTSTHYTS